MRRFVPFIALMLLAFAPAAQAAEINKEGAARLQKIFQDMIHYQESVSSLTEGGQFVFEGAVQAEPSGTYYAVTLPHTSVVYPDGRRAQIGMVSINATPHDKPGQWVMSVAVPTPIIMLDEKGEKAFQIDIGKQGAAGIWNESLQHFTKLDAKYQGISMRSFDGAFSALIPQASILYDLQEDAAGLWSGPAEIVLNNISVDIGNGTRKANIAEAKIKVDLQSYDPKALRAYKDNLVAMAETTEASEENSAISREHAIGLYNMIFELVNKAAGGFSAQYSLSGVSISGTPTPEEPEAFKIQVKNAQAFLSGTGFRNNRVSLALKLGFDGVTMDPVPTDGELMPSVLNIDVQLDNVPLQDIATSGKNALQGAMENPEMAKMAGMAFLWKVPALLSQAGTVLTLSNNRIGNSSYDAALDGKAIADINALNSATAKMNAKFRGLDWLIAAVQKRTSDPANPKPEEAAKLLENLQTIKKLAREEKSGVETSHVVDFEMTPQGQMLINGQDAKTVLMPKDSTPPAAGAAE
jgi:hypothetical protein